MLESFNEETSAKEEVKRADHLIYVTLKYTRTADVIHNTIKRLASAFEMCFEKILEDYKRQKKIKEVPRTGYEKALLLETLMKNDKKMMDYISFYLMLREIRRSEYIGKEEYRKHVTLISKDFRIKTDFLKELFETTKRFVAYCDEKYKND
ncbi:MAG: hypothetical protein PHE43_02235 [Candidatus Nanoarchaeia archaeon]|nr:hypothetical protein [Candidatus Nanoarchaeia archaeon]